MRNTVRLASLLLPTLLATTAARAQPGPDATSPAATVPAAPDAAPVTVPGAAPAADTLSVEDRSTVDYHGYVHDAWLPRDADGAPLMSDEFYLRIGRPDLVDARARRRTYAIGTLVGGVALTGAAIAVLAQNTGPSQQSCNINSSFSQFSSCVQANSNAITASANSAQANMPLGLGLAVGGALALGASVYLFTHPEPISEAEAERLAADYNRRHITAVTPFADGNGGGGVLVSGRF